MYRVYHYFVMLLKLDFFFFVTFSIALATLILREDDIEKTFTWAAVGLIPLLLVLAVFGLRRESKPIMFGVFLGFLAGMAYFIFKLYRMHSAKQHAFSGNIRYMTTLGNACYHWDIFHSTDFPPLSGVFSLILATMSLVFTIICYKNFGHGLKQHRKLTALPDTFSA
jgi:hypothetical protein